MSNNNNFNNGNNNNSNNNGNNENNNDVNNNSNNGNNMNTNANNANNDNNNNNNNNDNNGVTAGACWASLAVPALVILFGILMTYYMMGSNVHIALKFAGVGIAILAAVSAYGQVMLCARKQTAMGWGLGGATLAVVIGGIALLFAWLQNRAQPQQV